MQHNGTAEPKPGATEELSDELATEWEQLIPGELATGREQRFVGVIPTQGSATES